MLSLHPATGVGRFMDAYWTLPENPLFPRRRGLCNLGDGCGLGDIVTGIYRMVDNGVVPEILAKKAALEEAARHPLGPVGLSGCGCGSSDCGCEVGLGCGRGLGIIDCGSPIPCPCKTGSCGGNLVTGLKGLGGVNGVLDDVMGAVTGAAGNWTTWAMVGAGVLALVMFTGGGGSQRSAELSSARATYKAKVAKIKASRPRRYQKYV